MEHDGADIDNFEKLHDLLRVPVLDVDTLRKKRKKIWAILGIGSIMSRFEWNLYYPWVHLHNLSDAEIVKLHLGGGAELLFEGIGNFHLPLSRL